jgi:hypothetical protein
MSPSGLYAVSLSTTNKAPVSFVLYFFLASEGGDVAVYEGVTAYSGMNYKLDELMS